MKQTNTTSTHNKNNTDTTTDVVDLKLDYEELASSHAIKKQ